MSECQRPGCDGTLEDMGGGDLYCGTCGLAPVVVAAPAGPVPGAGAAGGFGAGSGGAGGAAVPGARSGADSGQSSAGSSSAHSSRSSRSSTSQASRRSVSGRLSQSLAGSSTGRSVSVRTTRGTGSGPTRGKLGAGLVSVPTVPKPDPAAAVLENPEVPERKRYCSKGDCGAPVGRSREGGPAAPRATAPSAGTRTPSRPSCARATWCTGSTT